MSDPRLVSIAKFVDCNIEDVETSFGNLIDFNIHNAMRSTSGKSTKDQKDLARIVTTMERLLDQIDGRPDWETEQLEGKGVPTKNDLQRLCDHYRSEAVIAGFSLKVFPSNRGKNWRAYLIAERVATLFNNTDRKIGFGQNDEHKPSTPFGKTVEHALEVFGFHEHWRNPTKEVAQSQLKKQ